MCWGQWRVSVAPQGLHKNVCNAVDTGLRRYDASYYKLPLVMLGYDIPRQGDFFLRYETGNMR